MLITRGREWNQPKKNCNGQLEPLAGSTYPGGAPPEVGVVRKVLSTISKPVYLLDITTLSQLRKDAHPSAYGRDHSGNDCSHWCLPGLPDTWNQLLYAALHWTTTSFSVFMYNGLYTNLETQNFSLVDERVVKEKNFKEIDCLTRMINWDVGVDR